MWKITIYLFARFKLLVKLKISPLSRFIYAFEFILLLYFHFGSYFEKEYFVNYMST